MLQSKPTNRLFTRFACVIKSLWLHFYIFGCENYMSLFRFTLYETRCLWQYKDKQFCLYFVQGNKFKGGTLVLTNIGQWIPIMVRVGGVLHASTPYAIAVGLWGFVAYLLYSLWHWQIPGQVHALLLLFLGFLLFSIISSSTQVFRDGRQFLGTVANGLRDLARQLASFVSDSDEREAFRCLLIAYGIAVRLDLQSNHSLDLLKKYLSDDELDTLASVNPKDRAFTILGWISQRLSVLEKADHILVDHRFIVEANLTAVDDALGACRRVQKAQLPVDFTVLGGLSIFLFCVTLPFVIVNEVGSWATLVMIVVTYLLVGMLELAVQTRDPYGKTPTIWT